MSRLFFYMQEALKEAKEAVLCNEVPVGAVIVHKGQIIAQAHNRGLKDQDPTAHAEMLVIREACQSLKTTFLEACDLYVTLEPCPMCAQAIAFARLRRVYFGAYDPKGGGVDHGPKIFSQPTCHHRPEIYGGLNEEECGEVLKSFFQSRRVSE